ncbi:transporter substrate-binding domain-containing protein [Tissierella sp. MB52-C2]|uniref:transporter substrate-binding domain-containing protein n=1 Tax=Tissierella sp. MB52-C2 TaxID=3070999 RepID=UPI00280BB472|nr:transporter substrate-binding domain-containing protein [Tissierella sp. MB52-C2]WMM25201.1 transporter substrate-binding domain-containing protein [Tissierella sp. MB52-C2]
MKFKKILISLLIFILAIGAVACGNKQEPADTSGQAEEKVKLVVGTSASYRPWAFQENDEVKGFEMDVWKEIAKRNDYELEFKLGQFSGLVGMLDAGEIDTVAHQMSITKEREEKYNFSEPYAYSYYDLFVAEDSDYKTKEDLRGKKVGCWLGGNGEATLRQINEEYDLGFDIVTFDGTSIEGELAIGRLAALWQGEIKTKTTIEENNLDIRQLNEKLVYEINAYPFRKDEAGKKFSKEVTEALKAMREDGTLEELSIKWFNIDTTKSGE